MIENTDSEQIERLNARVAELLRERDRLRAKLEQISTTCTDNMGPTCNHRMALDFVHQVADSGRR